MSVVVGIHMNIYKLPVDAYNRKHEQTISEDAIKDKLVGKKQKRKEIIDVSHKESEEK